VKTLFVAGDWGAPKETRCSGYMHKLACRLEVGDAGFVVRNGGEFDVLVDLAHQVSDYDVVYWFPRVSNEREKLLPGIKEENPKCILVASKYNPGGKYSTMGLIARALKVKANLLVEFEKRGNIVEGTILDPLGNCFASQETAVEALGDILGKRVRQLLGFTRVGTTAVSPLPLPPIGISDLTHFLEHARKYAGTFHELVHAAFQDRFLGNVSFRCERGFPSFRGAGGSFYASRRNMDKRFAASKDFVCVEREMVNGRLAYRGTRKPSVDAPIHWLLYRHYLDINYILHSHTYIEGARFTRGCIPCGAVEEFDEIMRAEPNMKADKILLNLKGHGSIVMGRESSQFDSIPYVGRSLPEMFAEESFCVKATEVKRR